MKKIKEVGKCTYIYRFNVCTVMLQKLWQQQQNSAAMIKDNQRKRGKKASAKIFSKA